jgi:Glycosyl transferases group 1
VVHSHMFGSNAWGSVTARLAQTPVMVAHEHMWSFDAPPPGDRPAADQTSGRCVHRGLGGRATAHDPSGRAPEGKGGRDPQRHQGPSTGRLEALTRELGIDQQLRLLGYRDDIARFSASDICVCCSDYEGGPLSVMEYMAAGKPVLSTNAGGLPELVESDVTGLLVNARDPEGLAAATRTFATGSGRRDAGEPQTSSRSAGPSRRQRTSICGSRGRRLGGGRAPHALATEPIAPRPLGMASQRCRGSPRA